MEKMEIRCKILEEKAEKLKSFKKMVKNSASMQCLHCSKHITNAIFLQHVASCLNDLQNPSQNSQKQQSFKQSSNANYSNNANYPNNSNYLNSANNANNMNNFNNNMNNLNNFNELLISINQTMVKESSDNKPYTEYLIQITYNNNKWTVARKYKNFCELHQSLYALFPNVKFPESVATVINSSTDVNNIFNSKRPTVIEERRKALQQFLRDLSKIEVIKNCKLFKYFLEIEKPEETSNKNNGNNNNNNNSHEFHNKNKGIIATITSLNSQRDSKNLYTTMLDEKKSSNSSKNTFSSNLLLPDEMPSKEMNLKIDKKMLPPSPSSFLNSWNQENRVLINHLNPNNKENKNPRSKSVSDNKSLNFPVSNENINNPAQTLVNDEENETDRIANIDVSDINSSLQADTQSFQEISNEKSILSMLKGENQGFITNLSSKNQANPFVNNEKFVKSQMDLYHSNQRPQSYYSKNIYSYNKDVNNQPNNANNQPNNNSSYTSNYEKKKIEKVSRLININEKPKNSATLKEYFLEFIEFI